MRERQARVEAEVRRGPDSVLLQWVPALPAEEVGRCVLRTDGTLYTSDARALAADLEHGRVRFHAGCIREALPSLMANGGR